MRVRRLKYLWFVYLDGVLDYVACDRKNAEEMSTHPTTGSREEFAIERWVFRNGKYEFDKRLKWED